MKCIFLAAGFGRRLFPFTEDFPKCLYKIDGKAPLTYLIEDIDDAAERFIIASNHIYWALFELWTQRRGYIVIDNGVREADRRLGAVTDLANAIRKQRIDDDVLAIAPENMVDFSLQTFLKFAKDKGTSCVMYYEEEDEERLYKANVITALEGDRIVGVENMKKVPSSNLLIPPFYYFARKDVPLIKKAIEEGIDVFSMGSLICWMSEHTTLHAMRMPGKRYEISDFKTWTQAKRNYRGIVPQT